MITIKKNYEFKRALSRGKSQNGKYVTIYFFPNRLNLVRFGFAIGKKAGKAVQRNRIRRVIREVARLTEIDETGLDVVFVWKNRVSAEKIDFFEIKKEVEILYNKRKKNNEKASVKSN